MQRHSTLALVSALALGIAACDSEDVENTPVDDIDEIADRDVNSTAMDNAYPVGGDLNETQQTNYDAMDRQAVSDEYDENYDVIVAEAPESAMTGSASGSGTSSSDGAMTDSGDSSGSGNSDASMSGDDTMAGSSSGSSSGTMSRGQMNFSYLDRNDDGQLSVAEYAIWAVPVDPNKPKPNDSTKPYLTQDQINEAGQTFFYFDDDGDTYLSPTEFTDARRSSRTP